MANKQERIAALIRKNIAEIIQYDLKNPHLTGMVSVTHVKTTPDLRYAQVFVSMIGEKSRKENLKILKQSSGFIRSEIAKRVNLRITPEIVIVFDDSIEYGEKIDSILNKISEDREAMKKIFKDFGDNNQ